MIKGWHNEIIEKDVTARMWDFGLKHSENQAVHGRSEYEEVTGNTPDISQFLDYDFFGMMPKSTLVSLRT